MKYKLLIFVALLGLATTGCKKEEYVTITNNGTGTEVVPNVKENYDHTNFYISTHKWKITPLFGGAGATLIWKLNVEGTNNFLIINPVDNSIYYRDEYKTAGSYIEGALVLTLSIKHP